MRNVLQDLGAAREFLLGDWIVSEVADGREHYIRLQTHLPALKINRLIGQQAERLTRHIFAGILRQDVQGIRARRSGHRGDQPLRTCRCRDCTA